MDELYAVLLDMLESFPQVFFIFDALDECHPETQRKELLPLFNRMGKDGICVFLTSRPHPQDIRDAFRDAIQIELSAKDEDIETYIRGKIRENPRARELVDNAGYMEKVISGLTNCAEGM